MTQDLANNTRLLSHLDIPGGGQIVVSDGFAYVGHMKPPHGTSIIDIADPKNPRLLCTLPTGSSFSHTHKVRTADDIMITNVEQDRRHFLRKSEKIPLHRANLQAKLGREPSDKEIAASLGVKSSDLKELEQFETRGYTEGGFKVWDIKDKANPKLLCYKRTHGFGVHRFDMDERYAYLSTEMAGYIGNILPVTAIDYIMLCESAMNCGRLYGTRVFELSISAISLIPQPLRHITIIRGL